jgi:hypothetical protein
VKRDEKECYLIELNWIDLHSMNPKQVNALDIDLIRKILHTYSSSWYSKLIKLSCSFAVYCTVFLCRVEGMNI